MSQRDCIGDKQVQERLCWDEIAAVFAYKRDCYTVDQIHIALSDVNDRIRIDVSEDDGGYRVLVDELPRHLSGCLTQDEWFLRVAVPAFQLQWTELYRRPPEVSPE